MTMHQAYGWINRVIFVGLGLFFAALTGNTLLADVHSFSEMKPDHWMTIGAMVGAIAAGLYIGPCLRNRHFGIALFMAVSLVGSTVYCLVGSAGRGDEAAFEKNAVARQINEDRARAARNLEEAKARYQAALDAETKQCATGFGNLCGAARKITEERRKDREVADLLLQRAKPMQRENGKLKRAAEIIAFFGGVSEEQAEKGVALVWPFIPPTICELLTIAFFHLGLAPAKRRRRKDDGATETKPDGDGTRAETIELHAETVSRETEIVSPSTKVLQFTRPATAALENEVKGYVLQMVEFGNLPSQATVAKRFNIHRATISRWFAKWEEAGLLERRREGRRNEITKKVKTV